MAEISSRKKKEELENIDQLSQLLMVISDQIVL